MSPAHRLFRLIVLVVSFGTALAWIPTTSVADTPSAPQFTQSPANFPAAAGGPATFEAVVTGVPAPTLRWQRLPAGTSTWLDIANGESAYTGAATSEFTVVTTSVPMRNDQFRLVATNGSGTATSGFAALAVSTSIQISMGSNSAPVAAGSGTSYSFTATGAGSLTYQWQRKLAGTSTWQVAVEDFPALHGTQATTLWLNSLPLSMNGDRFRVVVADSISTAISGQQLLTVTPSLLLTAQPRNRLVAPGDYTTMSVGASAPGPINYAWERLPAGSSTWTPLNGAFAYASNADAATINLNGVPLLMNGDRFRAQLTSPYGNATSEPAVLSVTPTGALALASSPANFSGYTGQNAGFAAMSFGNGPTHYQWEMRAPGAPAWTTVPDNSADISGAQTDFLQIQSVELPMNGTQFRVVANDDSQTIVSSAATLAVSNGAPGSSGFAPSITQQVTDTSIAAGQDATFQVSVADVTLLTSVWQRKSAGSATWENLNDVMPGISGAQTVTLVLHDVPVARDGDQFRVILSNPNGTTLSDTANLSVNAVLSGTIQISSQPANQTVMAGGTKSISVTAAGEGTVYYQWQRRLPGTAGWIDLTTNETYNSTQTTSQLTLVGVITGLNGAQFRVRVTDENGSQISHTANLTVTAAVVILTHPQDLTVVSGESATFASTYIDSGYSDFHWQWRQNSGAEWADLSTTFHDMSINPWGTTLVFPSVTSDLNGYQFRLFYFNPHGSLYTESATLTLIPATAPPSITVQPENYSNLVGTAGYFSASASGVGPITYQWQRLAGTGGDWANLTDAGSYSGATTLTLQIWPLTGAMNGDQFRLVVTNPLGSMPSSPATLTVQTLPPSIFDSSADFDLIRQVGTSVGFGGYSPDGTAPFTYKWQRLASAGDAWIDIVNGGIFSGATTNLLQISAVALDMDGDKFRVVISNSAGSTTTSGTFLRVTTGNPDLVPVISIQPSHATADAGVGSGFSAFVTGDGPITYQWQRLPAGGGSWTNIGNGGAYTGADSASLAITPVTLVMSGDQFRLIATNASGSITTHTVTLTVGAVAPPQFTSQPANATSVSGGVANFMANVTGTGSITYQWQRQAALGGGWTNVADVGAYNGATGPALAVAPLVLSMDGDQFRLIATNAGGATLSAPATLTVAAGSLAILTNPQSVSIEAGQATSFTASAGPGTVSYRWESKSPGSETWTPVNNLNGQIVGATSATLSLQDVPVSWTGLLYRAHASNETESVVSEPAMLTVTPSAAATAFFYQHPESITVSEGNEVDFFYGRAAVGSSTYQWQKRAVGADNWTNVGGTSFVLTVANVTLAMNGDQFRAVASDGTHPVSSRIATLQVRPKYSPNAEFAQGPAAIVHSAPGGTRTFSWLVHTGNTSTVPAAGQWYRNGSPIPGQTDMSLALNNLTAADNGSYTLRIVTSGGIKTSPATQLVVSSSLSLTIVNWPQSVDVVKGGTAHFEVAALGAGHGNLLYQWYRNGAPLANANGPVHTVTNVQAADAGDYSVVVQDDTGITSSPAAVLVALPEIPPSIPNWTASVILTKSSSSLLLGAIPAGTPPFSYQWHKDGAVIPGATEAGYEAVTPVNPSQAGRYSVKISNAAGTISSPDTVVTWLTGDTPKPWVEAIRHGDVVYFLLKSPGRILRYDLAQADWLPAVTLTPGKVPTAFQPTNAGVFVAYGIELVRRPFDLQSETTVTTASSDITRLIAAGNLLYYPDNGILKARNISTLAETLPTAAANFATSFLTTESRPVYSPVSQKFFTVHPGVPPVDIDRLGIMPDGTIEWLGAAGYQFAFPIGKRLVLSPDESLVFDSTGVVYTAPLLNYHGSVGLPFDDLTFLADGSAVALRGRQLVRHGGTGFAETGRCSLNADGAALFSQGDQLFAFSAPATAGGEPAVQQIAAASLAPMAPAIPGSPFGKAISIDHVFVDANQVLNIVSRSESGVIRWDPSSKQFLSTIPLRGRPQFSSYAPASGRLVLTYSDGALTDFFPGSSPTEEIFGNYPAANRAASLIALDEDVAMDLSLTPADLHQTFVTGAMGETKFHTRAQDAKIFGTWVSATRRLYYTTPPNGDVISFAAIPAAGEIPYSDRTGALKVPGPVRADPTGALLLAPNGRVYDTDFLQTGSIGHPVMDGTWLPDGLYTIRVRPNGTEVEKWTPGTYTAVGTVTVEGIPQRILKLDDQRVIVIAQANHQLAIHLIDTSLVVQSSTHGDDPNLVPIRPATFDAAAYLLHNPDVAADVGDGPDRYDLAWRHYYRFGVFEGRTDGDFSVQAYLAQYPNLAAIYSNDLPAAALYWYSVGRKNGDRIPAGFDVDGYFARNLDIKAYFANDKYGAWLHYYNYGLFEGRSFDTNFIAGEYLELNLDLKAAGGGDLQGAVLHWLSYGHPIEDRMGRVPIGFNVENYLARYPDLAAAFANVTPVAVRNVAVWHHYIAYGTLEGRSDGDFEAYDYLATNADLAAIFDGDVQTAALHWFFYGRREGRRIPFGFDVINYRTLYPDLVVFSGDDLYGCWLHYRDTGINEGRIYDNKFRPADYLALNPDIAAAVGNSHRDAFLHWIYYGQFEGRQGKF